jgi:hypothetical protein
MSLCERGSLLDKSYYCFIFLPMISPFRSVLRPTAKPTADDPFILPRPRGSRRPHTDGKVDTVRHLIETTLMTYAEIARRTGVPPASICRWSQNGKWVRPLFAPRATDTVPRWRASAKLRRRTLAARLHALAERAIRELEAAPRVDLAKLREALEVLKMTVLAERPRRRWMARRDRGIAPPLTEDARKSVIADLRANGVDIARAPSEALADFIESHAPGEDPNDNPAFKERKRRYSIRKRGRREGVVGREG